MGVLEVKNLGISFGGLRAVDDFNLAVEKGQLYGLIGPNGAGKERTSRAEAISRSIKPESPGLFRISVCFLI